MKYIARHKSSNISDEDFKKNIQTLKDDGFKVETIFDEIRMFVVDMKDDCEDDSDLEKLRSYDFIHSVERNKKYRLIG